MLEQELASIIKFLLDATGNPYPYYWKIPESFFTPSVYFAPPEIISGADMLATYSMEYAWNIMMFSSSDQAAYSLGQTAVEAIRRARNLIPLIDSEGNVIRGYYARVNDPSCRLLDTGACQVTVTLVSRRYYPEPQYEKAQVFDADIFFKGVYAEQIVTDAMVSEAEKYLPAEGN